MKKVVLILLTILLACNARAAAADVSSRLSNPNVRCFAQEPSGRMWIGKERGINS